MQSFDSPKFLGFFSYALLRTLTQSPHFFLNKVRVRLRVRVRVNENSCCNIQLWSIEPLDYKYTTQNLVSKVNCLTCALGSGRVPSDDSDWPHAGVHRRCTRL